MKNGNEKKFDADYLALVMIKQLYADKVINCATYKSIQEKYMTKGDQLCKK